MQYLHSPPRRSFLRQHGWWLALVLLLDIVALTWWFNRPRRGGPEGPAPAPPTATIEVEVDPPSRNPGPVYVNPTLQDQLHETQNAAVFMPTASGRVESALYGSVRTRKFGNSYLPAFHEAVDIAPMERDRRGRPLDAVYAAADGRVAYVNRVAGNSNYGIYVVLTHDDPVGEIYTLYSHLASVERDLRPGDRVTAGRTLGVMGHTSSSPIPVQRSHLHFEIGVINNHRFDVWHRAQKLKPYHGRYHGHNLTGIDPLAMLLGRDEEGRFSMLEYLLNGPAAFAVAVHVNKTPDYFRRYPALWTIDTFTGGAVVIEVSEGGVPLRARRATAEESAALRPDRPQVLDVDEEILGRNGLRLVVRRNQQWQPGNAMARWLEILTY